MKAGCMVNLLVKKEGRPAAGFKKIEARKLLGRNAGSRLKRAKSWQAAIVFVSRKKRNQQF
jgi:hypothetical protein